MYQNIPFKKILILLLITVGQLFAQQVIKGRIIDFEDKSGIPGTSIYNETSKKGIVSDQNGQFQVTFKSGDRLKISSVGYESQEKLMNSNEKEVLSIISLKKSSKELEQVIVVGYGSMKKSEVTGSNFSIKGEELVKIPVMTPTQAIQGKIPGVQIISNGKPGSSPTVRIRGIGSALAGVATLFVVDGILTDDISNINTNDITSLNVLKDASATAIYGARGANGVIIITTKKGKKGFEVTYNGNAGVRQAANLVQMANAKEYLNYIAAIGVDAPATSQVNTSWYDQILRTAISQNHSLSISTGSEKSSTLFSAGYLKEEGIVINNHFERFNFRLNQEFMIHPKFNASITSSYSRSNDKNVNLGTAYNNAYRAAPIIQGKENGLYGNTSLYQNVGNPILDLSNNNDLSNLNRLQAAVILNYEPVKNLHLRTNFGNDFNFDKGRNYTYKFTNGPDYFINPGGNQRNPTSNLSVFESNANRWVWDNTIDYERNFGAHKVKLLVGTTAEEYYMSKFGAFRKDVPESDNLWYLDNGNANTSTNYGTGDKWRRNSYLSRLNYAFQDKYIVTATYRMDGSSKFSQKNRWGYFPSVGLGWIVSEEPFMKELTFINDLKIKTSWGIVGNDRIPSDSYQVTVESNLAYPFGGGVAVGGSAITQIKDPNLKWESTEEFDFGTEFGLLNGKLQGEFGYYYKTSKDLLINVKVPSVVGDKDGMVLTNAASIQNKGIEAALTYQNKFATNWNIKVGGNITLNQNQVVGLNGGQPILDGGIGAGQFYTTKTDNGQPVGSFYLLKVLGVFQDDNEINSYKNSAGTTIQPNATPGSFKYQDTNDDGKIDDLDRVFSGSYQPKAYFGMNFNIGFKNLDLSFDVIGNVGNFIYNGKKAFRQGALDNVEKSMAYGRWTRGSGIQSEPAANAGYLPASTYFLEKGDFVRLNNVTLNYKLQNSIAEKLGFKQARVYLTGQNLLTLKEFTGFSPELSSNSPTNAGIELNAYPINKSLVLGLSFGF